MKKIDQQDLRKLKAYELVSKIQNGKSLLISLGAWKYFLRISPLRFLATFIIFLVLFGVFKLPENQRHAAGRKRLVKVLNKISPFKMTDSLPGYYTAPLVIGFNHSSLGDILRIAAIVIERYPAKALHFPANLIFYEALAPVAKKLEQLSIYLYPMITPSTREKIKTDKNAELVDVLKFKLERHYLSSAELCCHGYGILVIAPSATRKPTIFDNSKQAVGEDIGSITPTMTILLKRLSKNKKVVYVAVSLNPQRFDSGLNLFRTYRVNVAKEFSTEEAEALDTKSPRGFDYAFLRALAESLPYERWHPPTKEEY